MQEEEDEEKIFHFEHDGEASGTLIPFCPHCYRYCRAGYDDGSITLGNNEIDCEHCGKKFWCEADISYYSRREE